MQLISTITKNVDPEDKLGHHTIVHHMEVPSLLHVIDKTDLKRYVIKKDTEDEKNEGYLSQLIASGALKYKTEEQIEKEQHNILKK